MKMPRPVYWLCFLLFANSYILADTNDRAIDFIKGVKLLDGGNYEGALNIFNQLKAENYDAKSPLLNFMLGRTEREIGRKNSDPMHLKKALVFFQEYKKDTDSFSTEYKAAEVLIAYTFLDIANNSGKVSDYELGINEIDEYIRDTPNETDKQDGSVLLCKANAYNALGFYYYQKKLFLKAIKKMEAAYKGHEKNWPIFANNLINAYIAESEVLAGSDRSIVLLKACNVYKNNRDFDYWKNDQKFVNTGSYLVGQLTKYRLQSCLDNDEPKKL